MRRVNLLAMTLLVFFTVSCAAVPVAGHPGRHVEKAAHRFDVPPMSMQTFVPPSYPCSDGGSAAFAQVIKNGKVTHITIYRQYQGEIYLVAVTNVINGELSETRIYSIADGTQTTKSFGSYSSNELSVCDVGMVPGGEGA